MHVHVLTHTKQKQIIIIEVMNYYHKHFIETTFNYCNSSLQIVATAFLFEVVLLVTENFNLI